MGIFDYFKKHKQPVLSGWEEITRACEEVYPTQKGPLHYGTLVKWQFGGKDPLDGISIYEGPGYWHFVTYGLTELYEKKSKNKDVSGFGMEFTFKLKKDSYADPEMELKCICGILQSLARITFETGEVFLPNEYVYTGQSTGIDRAEQSDITGFITVKDPDIRPRITQNGCVQFVEFIGVTSDEILAVHEKKLTAAQLYEKLGSDVTDYHRKSIIF